MESGPLCKRAMGAQRTVGAEVPFCRSQERAVAPEVPFCRSQERAVGAQRTVAPL